MGKNSLSLDKNDTSITGQIVIESFLLKGRNNNLNGFSITFFIKTMIIALEKYFGIETALTIIEKIKSFIVFFNIGKVNIIFSIH